MRNNSDRNGHVKQHLRSALHRVDFERPCLPDAVHQGPLLCLRNHCCIHSALLCHHSVLGLARQPVSESRRPWGLVAPASRLQSTGYAHQKYLQAALGHMLQLHIEEGMQFI